MKVADFGPDIVFTARKIIFALLLFAAVLTPASAQTNYYCVVCGKGPLTGRIWISKWGPVCDDCYQLKDHCSICGLPIKDGDGHITTPDGRFICRFDKTNVVMDVDEAKYLFADTARDVVEMYGQGFGLQYPSVTVAMFDVDYWSERGRPNGLHAFGFASTRKTADGRCIHEVVMLSGRLREEMIATAAHEYTHLWINENRPDSHVIDLDTIEAICELTAYNLMGEKNLPEMQQRILANPYTHGEIKTLVAVYQKYGIEYILNWVKNGTGATLDAAADDNETPAVSAISYVPPKLPIGLKFEGLLTIGQENEAVINGVPFSIGDEKKIKLRDKTVVVRCDAIHDYTVVVELNGSPEPVILERDIEKTIP
ncbi:MAG TPA: hypothetical protein VMD27_11360 [Candidatus Aquilonibacter sp.]|nr:hypothetical protein [Candidatus Aquilonibacter sp.]